MRVEQVRRYRVFHAHRFHRHPDRNQRRTHLGAQLVERALFIKKCHFVVEQHRAVAHGNHIVVEHPSIDGLRVLLGKDGLGVAQPVLAGHRLAGFQRLPGRITLGLVPPAAKRLSAIHEQVHAGLAILAAQAGVVGRPFIGKCGRGRQHRVMGKVLLIAKNRLQHAAGSLRL